MDYQMTEITALLLDLDGTIYRGGDAVPGACEFVVSLQRRKIPYLFVTNRGNRRPESIAGQLQSMGIPCQPDHVLTSSQAVATQLDKGTRAFCIGVISRKECEYTEIKPTWIAEDYLELEELLFDK
jgi:ribonucleotide monophosphatase NagD (HAD superfamily)